MTLNDLARGASARIDRLDGAPALVQRLLAMGFLPGTPVTLVQIAPLGDPVTLELEGWRVSLRRADAACVRLQPEEAPLATAVPAAAEA